MQPQWKRPIALVLIAVLTLVMLTPFDATAQGPGNGGSLSVPITGFVTPAGATSAVPFTGALAIQRFDRQGSQIVAIGTVTGTAAGVVYAFPAAVPVHFPDAATARAGAVTALATCDILTLVLGPLHLDLLGLVVDLNQVILTITGQTGAGNLLGNLLCAIAGLLDPSGVLNTGALNQIIQLLNRILAAL